MDFKVTANFHPTLTAMGQLDEVKDWFSRVFARPLKGPSAAYLIDGYNNEYCFTMMAQDVFFDVMDPSRFSSSNNPPPPADTPPFLSLLAFYLDDLAPLIATVPQHGLILRDIKGTAMTGDTAPTPIPHGKMVLTDPNQAGYIYELFSVGNTPKHKSWGVDVDPRFLEGWDIPPVSSDDPLALEYCASHTMLSDKPERLRHLFVDVLGGQEIHRAANEALGTDSIYVALGDGVYELAQPVGDGLGRTSLNRQIGGTEDCYHGITFKTADLPKARAHLLAQGVPLVVDTPDLIITDAAQSAGVYWGFTSQAITGDTRGTYPDLFRTIQG